MWSFGWYQCLFENDDAKNIPLVSITLVYHSTALSHQLLLDEWPLIVRV